MVLTGEGGVILPDPVILARTQFGFTVEFPFLFPPLTFGLMLAVPILVTLRLRSGAALYRQVSAL